MGSTYNYLMINLSLLCLICIFKNLHIKKAYNWLQSKFLWNYFLRFIIQQYVTIFISCLINFYRVDLSMNGEITALVSSIVLMIVCIASPIVMIAIVLKKLNGVMSDE